MLQELLNEKDYLPLLRDENGEVTADRWPQRRRALLALLERYSYGVSPAPVPVRGTVLGDDGTTQRVRIECGTPERSFSFPAEIRVPRGAVRPPVFLHLAFRPIPDRYVPWERILDAGFALAVVVYTDIVNDDHFGDFSDGVAAYFGTTDARKPDEWGKIGMWAYGASRLLDYLISDRPDLDAQRTVVIGHSRLGKTALWCAALDERFAGAVSNDSGYGGAASSKHGTGERVTDFLRVGSWDWYCENFKRFTGDLEDRKPYDQSFLLSMIAPRYLCVGSAAEDGAADPISEFLTTLSASAVWELLGSPGLVCPDRLPEAGDRFFGGNAGYQMRPGKHALTEEDWDAYIAFFRAKFGMDKGEAAYAQAETV
jgi:hypothetical protein